MIMDLIIAVIFVLTIFFSMRKGFMFTVALFSKGIVSLVAAYFLSGKLGAFIESSSVGEATKERIFEMLSSKWQDSEVYRAIPEVFRGSSDSISSNLIEESANGINHAAWIILSFIIILIFIRVALGLLVRMTKSAHEKKSFTGAVDWILGLILGIVMGVIVVFLFLALLFPVASLVAPGHAEEIMAWFNGSIFAQDLYDNNLLLLLLSNLFQ
ncbi:MAG: CvpA family protein [Firmicutes bacterium]|nr:CvpA family protein [Bacillota bacterium]